MQERALSIRIIHFCNAEILWECRDKTNPICPCGFEAKSGRSDSVIGPCAFNNNKKGDLRKTWQKIVCAYTRGSLSYQSDRLQAISGLARRFALQNIPYVAGMWCSESMIQDLGWYNTKGFRTPRFFQEHALQIEEGMHTSERLPQDYAPSWSWVCIDAPVSFDHQLNDRVLDWGVKDVAYTYASSDCFGPVASAALVLESYVFPVSQIDANSLLLFTDKYLGDCFISWDKGSEGGEWGESGFEFRVIVACWDLLNFTGLIARRKSADAYGKHLCKETWQRIGLVWFKHEGRLRTNWSHSIKEWKSNNSKHLITLI